MQSEYSLTKMPRVQSDLENDFVELKSDNNVLGNTIRHHYRQTNSFINLSDSYFEVAFSITADAADKTLVNHVGSLFRRATLKINGVTVEQVENLNHVLLLNSMIKYSDDYSRSNGSNMFYYHDTGSDAGTTTNLTRAAANLNDPGNLVQPAYNDGFRKRLSRTVAAAAGPTPVVCRMPLHEIFQFASVDKVIYGQEFETELVRSELSESLFGLAGAGDAAGALTVNRVSIWINKRVPDRETELAFMSSISAGLDYDFNFLYQTAYLTPVLNQNANQLRITTQSEKLVSAFVMMVPSVYTQVISKTLAKDTVTNAEIILNNVRYPVRKYEELTTESGKSRTYHALSHMLTGGDLQSGIGLTFDEYKRSTIIPFNFQSQANLTGGPSVIELNVNVTDGASRAIVVLISEKSVKMSYSGAAAVVTVM